MDIPPPSNALPVNPTVEMDRLGDEIAELSAHLDAATARLLDLIREFDARGGWGNGFASCAHWLNWRGGLDLGAAPGEGPGGGALGGPPRPAGAPARGGLWRPPGRGPIPGAATRHRGRQR